MYLGGVFVVLGLGADLAGGFFFLVRRLNGNFQKLLRDYLGARGIDDELSFFLHDYIMNKDRIELLQWLRTVKSVVEK